MQKKDLAIQESVTLYKETLLQDMNLKLNLTVNEKTYTTKILEWYEEKMIIEAPLEKLDWVLFESDTKIKISFISKRGIFATSAKIINRYKKHDRLYYGVEIMTPIIKQQQRQHFRLDVLLEVGYRLLPDEIENEILMGQIDEVPLSKGTTVNISTGGMCLVSEQQLHKGNRVFLSFNFMDTSLGLVGEVIYLGEKNTVGAYVHRIRFIGVDKKTENKLNKLIFAKQRTLIGKSVKVPIK